MKRILLLWVWLLSAGCCFMTLHATGTTNPQAVTALLNRIGGDGTASRFVTIVDDALSTNGKDIFVITSQNGKPCIKGNCILAVTTGINWYLNHYAHVNLTWNQLTADLSAVDFPVPSGEETHTCSADLRYYLNYCTYSYSCALWTTERWLQEIDWMALHGINMPLMLVGLDAVWYDLYTEEYGYTAAEVSKHVAGPAFQGWWGMINLEGHGGPNPKWWYERSRALCQTMLARMRSFGMTPVLPAFSGAVPRDFGTKGGATEVNSSGYWQGIEAPGLIGHKSNKWDEVSKKYYEHLKNVMGTSKYYSMDVNHEGGTYLDKDKTPNSFADQSGFIKALSNTLSSNVSDDAVWVVQAWGHNPSSTLLNNVAQGKLMVLDLFGENDPRGKNGSFGNHNFIYCMLHNFGGRIGLHGRFDQTMDNYYASLTAKPGQCKGIGATPEGIETNPMLYDMLYELPWMDKPSNKFDWVKDYTTARYGQVNTQAQNAYDKLYHSVYNCTTGQQGTSEPIVCAQPSLTATKVSAWSTAVISHNTDFVIEAADDLLSQVEALSGNNYNYDLLDVTRQALTDYATTLLQQLNSDWNKGGKDNADFAARSQHYLNLIEGIDKLLNTHQSYRYGNWGEMARAIASEPAAVAGGATSADADWLEHDNLRLQITSWDTKNNWSLFDYSNREWGGMLKDYYMRRWELYFDHLLNGSALPSSWYEWGKGWQKDTNHTYQYTAAPEGNTKTIAKELFNTYFWSLTDTKGHKSYVRRHVEQTLKNDVYATQGYRGENYTAPLPNGATLSSLSIDLNNDGAYGDGETFTEATVAIPAGAAAGLVKARLVLDDQTVLNYQLALADNITKARTVSVSIAAGCENMGSVSIDDHDGTSVTTTDYLTLRANAYSGYDFLKWNVDINGTMSESTDNPYHYYGKDAATLTAHFVQSIWGVPGEDWTDSDAIRNNQYVTSISYTQDGNTTEIYTASAVPTTLFNTAPTLVQVAKGSCFKVNLSDAGNMSYCNLSAYIDLNGDGDFDDEGELVTVRGNKNSQFSGICNDPITVLLPYDMPTGITHLRLRFDGAWKSGYDSETGAFPAKNTLNRMCYEVLVNVLDKANHATHIVIKSEDENKGTVRNITGVSGVDINVPVGTQICMEAEPKNSYKFKHWEDKYGRVASTDASFYYYPAESGEFTARFESTATLTYNDWKFAYEEIDDKVYIIRVDQSGSGALDMTQANSVGKELMGIAPTTFQGNASLTSLILPASCIALDSYLNTSYMGAGTENATITPDVTIPGKSPWQLTLCGTTDGASSYNDWGSGLLATGTNALADYYTGGFQLYWAKNGTLTAKVNGPTATGFSTTATSKFKIVIVHDGQGKVTMSLYADNKDVETKTFTGVTFNDITTFSHSIPAGINVTSLFISDPTLHNKPFSGCSAVEKYAVAEGNEWFQAVDGNLCSKSSGDLLAYAEGKLYQRAYTLKNASDKQYVITNPPADANGAIQATDYNNAERVVSTAASPLTPAALVRFAKVSGKNEIFHLNSGGYYGGKSGSGGNGQQIEVLALAQWAGDYTLTKRSEFGNDLVADVSLKCNDFYLASSKNKFILSNTEPSDGNASVWQLAEATSLPITVSDALWTATCLPVDVVVPATDECKVYIAETLKEGNYLSLTQVPAGTLLKAGEGVVINTSEAKTIKLDISYTGEAVQLTSNLLNGATARRTGLTAETFYGLGNKDGVGFYLSAGTQVPANKAYLLASKVGSKGASALLFDFSQQTGISLPEANAEEDDIFYNLRGQRVLYPTTGVYVTGSGKKVLIK
ncbi:MAG: alpha-N-acetylglucosaminidase [Bacteroidales bacterium]|nr:alpha-N-acetylglucosaminidase [Bacteroidales bacterium]